MFLQQGTIGNWKKEKKKSENNKVKTTSLMKRKRDAQREGFSHFRSNHETSPYKSSVMVSYLDLETKKYRDFQSWKEVRNYGRS